MELDTAISFGHNTALDVTLVNTKLSCCHIRGRLSYIRNNRATNSHILRTPRQADKKNEKKEVNVDDFLGHDAATDAISHSM